jgi:FAD/FMN-containing dehydrogenase
MSGRCADGFYRPATEREVGELVRQASVTSRKVRVRGAAHSTRAAILTGDFDRPPADDRDINISLDRMNRVLFDDVRRQVTVEAGCSLSCLFNQLDERGWALPTTAGITHQTVGGFLSTGSSGGTLFHSIGRQVVALRLVDGRGAVHEWRKDDDPDNPFYAAGVSLGLLGIITAVTFQAVDRFRIVGSETSSSYAECPVDLVGGGMEGRPSLEQFFRTQEYSRLLWFPQPGVERVTIWQARRMTAGDGPVVRRPYHVFPLVAGSMRPAQLLLDRLLRMLDPINPPAPRTRPGRLRRRVLERLYPWLARLVLNAGTQHFQDTWLDGLPMDNRVDNALLPTEFTEMWFPLERTRDVMHELGAYYREGGYRHSGAYCCEIYCAPRSEFWLSPAFGHDVVKINLFWHARNRGNPTTDFFPGVWQRLKKHGYRMHWGKLLSGEVDYLSSQYPRWDDFFALRARLDPQQLFVSEYWRAQLGVAT